VDVASNSAFYARGFGWRRGLVGRPANAGVDDGVFELRELVVGVLAGLLQVQTGAPLLVEAPPVTQAQIQTAGVHDFGPQQGAQDVAVLAVVLAHPDAELRRPLLEDQWLVVSQPVFESGFVATRARGVLRTVIARADVRVADATGAVFAAAFQASLLVGARHDGGALVVLVGLGPDQCPGALVQSPGGFIFEDHAVFVVVVGVFLVVAQASQFDGGHAGADGLRIGQRPIGLVVVAQRRARCVAGLQGS